MNLSNVPPCFKHHVCHAIKVAVQDVGEVLRLHAFGLIGESDDIGKEYRELLPATADSRILSPFENGLIDLPRKISGELKGEVLQPSMRLLKGELGANARQDDGRTHRFGDIVHRAESQTLAPRPHPRTWQ